MKSSLFRVEAKGFSLKDRDPAYKGDYDKETAQATLERDLEEMRELQDKFYAYDRAALLIIFQAIDAAGKDSTIKHVMSGLNPTGCMVHSFKAPSPLELDHDYMWRSTVRLPGRGMIGIFNRSYYEEVLVVRVHPEMLAAQKLPPDMLTKNIWEHRFEDINAYEKHLTRNGTKIVKLFLNVSKEEQRKRFLERIDNPSKNWKISKADLVERGLWDKYQDAFDEMLRHTSTDYAPWYVIPADRKWFLRMVVAHIINHALREIDPHYPTVTDLQRAELQEVRQLLENES